ncbi:carboxypeptidase-like regulatory domain-containing protein [Marinobacterium rhizophilum]|uniref:carboxypeptidase-like regulatory domain-containing protein n=1 Tax=Marinobacterium rhizophilum TaxID=420402 RepID=UPI000380505D|nr:carboxypeptidase-like regulatory domain-containing protein [Marinobacterium rhizophilum]
MGRHHPYLTSIALALFLLASFNISAAPSMAPDHRYTIKGFVLDEQDNPQVGVKVVATANNGMSDQRTTDRRGFYQIRLHFHNEDLGRLVTVRAGEQETRIRATFDPKDGTTNREHNLNFIGATITETDLGFRGLPTWAYVAAGLSVLLLAAARGARLLKRRRRRLSNQEHKSHSRVKSRSRRKSRAR